MARFYLNQIQIYIFRFLKFLFSFVLLLIIIFDIFPFFIDKTGWLWAILITYIVSAYLLIPLSIRFKKIVFRIDHIPAYTITSDGLPMDPVNLMFVGEYTVLNNAFKAIGWHKADERSVKNILRTIKAILLDRSYPGAPFSNLYLFGRKQDIGYQKAINTSPVNRHHLRVWGIDQPNVLNLHDWKEWHRTTFNNPYKSRVWLGAATEDTGLGMRRHTFQLTHSVNKNANCERDYIIRQLRKTGLIESIETHNSGEILENMPSSVNHFTTDGKIKIIFLCN